MKITVVSFFSLLAATFFFPVLAQQMPQAPAEKIYVTVEEMPQFPGGQDSMMAYIGRNTRYPQEAMLNSEQGVSILSFVVTASGNVTQPQILKSASPSLDAEALRVVNSMPVWLPGKQNGQPVAVRFTLPVRFQLASEKITEKQPLPPTDSVVVNIDEHPEFPGGLSAMMDFLSKNIKYPKEARKNKIEGLSVIAFVIDKEGLLSEYKIMKSLGYGTDEEAIRVLQRMPKWKPGKRNGIPVKVRYTLPVQYSL